MDYYDNIKNYSINKSDLDTYYKVGKMLAKAGKHYGEEIIKDYSNRLTNELGKGYSKRNLWLMIKFYELKEKMQTLSAQLTWSHYVELLSFQDINKVRYYIKIVEEQNLSIRQLRERIKTNEYERLPIETKKKIVSNKETSINDYFKNPIIIKNNYNYTNISEKILQKIILEDIEPFMKELGNSFCFVGSEYKIKIGGRYNYIDLLLFNFEFNCFVVIELKVTELKKEHIGQIEVYMNYVDEYLKKKNHNKSIGMIICKHDNAYIIRYCSDDRIIAREYLLV